MSHDTRKLTADELYPFLYRDYRRAQVRIGELESYIDELKYENNQLKHQLNQTQNELKEITDMVPAKGKTPQDPPQTS